MDRATQTSPQEHPRQPYQCPIVRVYGQFLELTMSSMAMGSYSDQRGFRMDSRTH